MFFKVGDVVKLQIPAIPHQKYLILLSEVDRINNVICGFFINSDNYEMRNHPLKFYKQSMTF